MSVCTGFISCGNKKSTEVDTAENGRILTKTDSEVKGISGGDYISKEIRKEDYYEKDILVLEDRVVYSSENSGLDIIYSDEREDYIEPQNDGFYIVDYIATDDFLIWVEANVKDIAKGNIPLREEYIYSRNIETGEFMMIANLKYDKLEDIHKGVKGLDVSKNNNLTYKYFKANESGKVEERVMFYDLEKNFFKKVAVNTAENIQIENVNIGLNNVIYTESEFDSITKELKNQKLINYTVEDGKSEEIDIGLEIKNLDIYDKDIVFITENKNENLELYIYNLESSQLTSRVYEESNLDKYYEKVDGELDYNTGNLEIDESYIYMLGQSNVVYDLEQKRFVVLENDLVSKNYDYMYSKKVGNKKVLVVAKKGEEKVITEYTLK